MNYCSQHHWPEQLKSLPVLILSLVAFGCFDNYSPGAALAAERAQSNTSRAMLKQPALRHARFELVGVGCPACLIRIANRTRALPGVLDAQLPLKRPAIAEVVYDSARTDLAHIMQGALAGQYVVRDLIDQSLDQSSEVAVPRDGAILRKFVDLPVLQGPPIEMP